MAASRMDGFIPKLSTIYKPLVTQGSVYVIEDKY